MNDIDAQINDVIRSMPASLCQEVLQGMYPAGPPPVEESVFGTLPSSTHYLEPAPSAFYTPQGVPFGESHALSVPGGQLAFNTLPNVLSSAPYPSLSSIEGPMFGTIPNVPSNFQPSHYQLLSAMSCLQGFLLHLPLKILVQRKEDRKPRCRRFAVSLPSHMHLPIPIHL